MSKPKFSTERFDVFKVTCSRRLDGDCTAMPRDVYLAFPKFNDIQRPLCTVTIFPEIMYVEWIEVDQECRCNGIASEVMDGLEKYLGENCSMEGATKSGRKFCESYLSKRE